MTASVFIVRLLLEESDKGQRGVIECPIAGLAGARTSSLGWRPAIAAFQSYCFIAQRVYCAMHPFRQTCHKDGIVASSFECLLGVLFFVLAVPL